MQRASSSLRRARPLLGTFVEISVTTCRDECSAAQAIDAAFDAVALVHNLMSFHEPGSDVGRLNREGAQGAVTVHPWTYQVMKAAVELQRESDGCFDVTVAPALQALHLLPSHQDADGADSLSDAGFAAPVSDPIILLPDHRIRLREPGIRIDLGGIAKGFAADQAATVLREYGVVGGLVNAGGDIAAFGPQPHRIHVRDPNDPARFISWIDLEDAGLASSGRLMARTRATEHIASAVIDPLTGTAVAEVAGATVRAHSCMMADALTKPVMVCGEASLPLLEKYHASALLVGPDGDVHATSNWMEACNSAA
ncbi:MAG TPA: FAD:protein FMN transferase [Gemmatimonadaceae bacterium]